MGTLEVYKHRFDVQLGEASIRAITDGRLCSRSRTDIHAIVEVKPFVLTPNVDATLMQMGIEMLAWISDCEKRKTPKEWLSELSQGESDNINRRILPT
jgi:hypothetical protein